MILPDTSAWIEYDRGTGSPVHLRLRELIATTDLVVTTEPVVMEFAAGARTDQREEQLRQMMNLFPLLRCRVPLDLDGATFIYRTCRQQGVTPRGLLDCVIASVALRHEASILAQDGDLTRIAGVVGLRLEPLS